MPGLSANPAVREDAEVCDKKEFLVLLPRRECKQCDENCSPGHCFDFVGCMQCMDGFYSVHSEQGAPYECLECVLPNCQTCTASAVECGGPATCVQCLAGFTFDKNFNCMPRVLREEATASSSRHKDSQMRPADAQEALVRRGAARNGSRAAVVRGESHARRSASHEAVSELAITTSAPALAPALAPAPEVGVEDSVALYMDVEEESSPSISVVAEEMPRTALDSQMEDVDEESSVLSSSFRRSGSDVEDASSRNASSSDSPCPMSHFLWNVSIPCIKCDAHAAPGACENFIGCVSCLPGYFRQRLEKDSPFICAPCTVPNCAVCEDDVLMHSTARCKVCIDGFNLIEETGSCIPA